MEYDLRIFIDLKKKIIEISKVSSSSLQMQIKIQREVKYIANDHSNILSSAISSTKEIIAILSRIKITGSTL